MGWGVGGYCLSVVLCAVKEVISSVGGGGC